MGRGYDGDRLRRGVIPGVGRFEFHGVGCRVIFEDGTEVDFDWNACGEQVFDVWRVRAFAQSRGYVESTDAEYRGALVEMADEGRLRRDRDNFARVRRQTR